MRNWVSSSSQLKIMIKRPINHNLKNEAKNQLNESLYCRVKMDKKWDDYHIERWAKIVLISITAQLIVS